MKTTFCHGMAQICGEVSFHLLSLLDPALKMTNAVYFMDISDISIVLLLEAISAKKTQLIAVSYTSDPGSKPCICMAI